MATLLFKLNNVPEDEAQEVRELLAEHEFATYETHAGFWGLGVSAIWLSDKSQLPEAKAVLGAYQKERTARQRQLFHEQEAQGEVPTVKDKLFSHPIRFIFMVLAIIVVASFTLLPFLALMA
ncbi:DUF6164 family protein [Marinimicrobium sp. ABcell2]|uniref:DUF6164 family protein n=1 Tax=Marinimicrobium sp. ABcell2 TaxID=3069751 RepID=UPI0027B1C6E4|nr:DUF6164 family protein [Marinimicrobium sp. ABcell2]MDQ2075177.1 DUF6164 family protein [Marinimicrobium sp. ABcell2]